MSGSAYLDEFLYFGQEFTEIDQWRDRILSKALLVVLVRHWTKESGPTEIAEDYSNPLV